jgi:hypothetical protein
MTFTVFLEGLAGAVIFYLIFHLLKFPKIFSWLAFFIVFIFGLAVSWLDAKILYQPFLDSGGAINWGSSVLTTSHRYLRLALLSTSFVPLVVILIRQYIKTKEFRVRTRAIGLGFAVLAGIIIGFFDFFVDVLNLATQSRDIIISVLGILLFIAIYLTQKAPKAMEKL